MNLKCNQSNDFLHLSNQHIGASAITLAFNWFPFQCSKINKYEDHFFQCSLCHIINLLLTKLVRSRWLGIGLVLFLRFYGPRYRLAKRRGIYSPLFTDPEGDSCFSIYEIRWLKKCRFINGHNFFF